MLFNSLKRLATDFELLESEGGSNTNVPNAADDPATLAAGEEAVINKLDRSVKFDEVDTVTFGLETDDGKIVKVYVNAEQAETFEKALAAKLGEIDDIEEVLNELAKEYEIIDVEWPEDSEKDENPEEKEHETGKAALDQRVYGPDRKGSTEDSFDRNFSSSESTSESLTYGEEVTLALLESSSSIESRFTTAAQLMVYHAILDLGVPEIALARNSRRADIIKGIKETALNVQKNASMKLALKTFIRRTVDFEKQAEENVKHEEAHVGKSDPYLDGIMKHKGVKEDMGKINISEDRIEWTFSTDKENLTIACKAISMTVGSEETEKLIKGINNHAVTVVRDESEDPAKKYVFSPRGSSVLVKQVGSPDGFLMTSKDVEEMISTAAPERKPNVSDNEDEVKESIEIIEAAWGEGAVKAKLKVKVEPKLSDVDRKSLSAFIQTLKRDRPTQVKPGSSFQYRGSTVTFEKND